MDFTFSKLQLQIHLSSSHDSFKNTQNHIIHSSKLHINTLTTISLFIQQTIFFSLFKAFSSYTFSKKMASSQTTMLITLFLFSLAFSFMSASEEATTKTMEKKVDVVVEGMVYCQSCNKFGSWSLTGSTPISAAKVSVICKNQKNQVSYYKSFATNANGYFYAQLDGFKMKNNLSDHPLQSCHVKLVSSPLQSCNLLTNVNYGLDGSPLRYEKKNFANNNYEAVIYAAGPLAFRPAYCTPSTHN